MHQYELKLFNTFSPNWGEVGNKADFEHSEAVLILGRYILTCSCSQLWQVGLLCITLPSGVHVMCLRFCLASLRTHISSSLVGTLSLATFMKSSAALRPTSTLIHVREANLRLANNPTGLWEPCVCLSAFPGARSVCAGSEEARALIKEDGWYMDASLRACGTHGLMRTR